MYWGDDVILRVDDVKFLENNDFIIFAQLFISLSFQSIVYILIFKSCFIM